MKAFIDTLYPYYAINENYKTAEDTLGTAETDTVVGYRISEIREDADVFEVEDDDIFYWVDLPEGIAEDTHCWNPTTNQFVAIPQPSQAWLDRVVAAS